MIGREFSAESCPPGHHAARRRAVSVAFSLQRKEFLYEQPAFPEVEYIFKHALTQEVAYGTVLHEQRKALHERTAKRSKTLYRANLEEHYSELAHHYSRSGNTQKAIEYLQLAGQQAVQRSAYAEAITHLTTALELLKTLPDTPERTQQELTLQIALGAAVDGYQRLCSPEVERAYTRARELCQQVGETPQLFPVLLGLWVFYLRAGGVQTARELAEQLLRSGPKRARPGASPGGPLWLGRPYSVLGELVPARGT